MREEQTPFLLVDAGGYIPWKGTDRKLRADVTFWGMKHIGYDAVNLGASDFFFGMDYLKSMAADLSIPFVSTNLLFTSESESWFENHLIREINGIRVGILGLISPESFEALPNRNEITDIHAVSPDLALKETVSLIRESVDIVLLLYHLGPDETNSLLHEVNGIDLAIVACTDEQADEFDMVVDDCHEKEEENTDDTSIPVVDQGLLKLCTKEKGTTLGSLEVQKSSNRPIEVLGVKEIELGDSVPHDPEIDDFITQAFQERKREQNRKKREEEQLLHEELMKGLELTPEEFFKQQRENPSHRLGTDQEQDNR